MDTSAAVPSPQPTTTTTTTTTLSGKVAVISGSSSGIGAAIARELASRGASVVINYPFPSLRSQADAVVASLPKVPAPTSPTPHSNTSTSNTSRHIAVEADLSTTTGPGTLIAAAAAEHNGQIDILVNNAALAINLPFEEQTLAHWDTLVNLNGRGVFLLTQAVLKHLPPKASPSGGGRIINIVSISSRGPPPMQTLYAGTKGMVDSFTRCWAKELPPKYGCTVNAVSPGPTRTEGFADAGEEVMKILRPVIEATPVGARMAETEEIAYAVAVLCEERARWINGTHLMATGGLFVD